MSNSTIDEIIRAYFADDTDLAAVYLYGSFAMDQAQDHSDVDIGLLYPFGRAPDIWKRIDIASDLTNRLERKVDLIDLNTVSPMLAMQVLKKGRQLLCRNQPFVHAFFVRTVTAYADLKIVRRPIERNLGKVGIYDRS